MNWYPRREPRGVAELNDFAYRPAPFPPDYVSPPQPGASPTVQVVEPVQGWWRQAGAFGQRFQDFVPPEADTVIALTEQLTLPGPPSPWWLNWFRFNRNQGGEADDPGNWEFRGRIIYGVGGIQNTIDVDLIQGVQFPIVANSLTVQLVTVNPYDDSIASYSPGDRVVTAGCMFGKGGGSAGCLPPTWSSRIVATGVGGLARVEVIPDFARSVVLHVSTVDPVNLAFFSISFLDLGGSSFASVSLDPARGFDVLSQEKGVPIPFGANSVLIFAPAGVGVGINAQLQFFLAL